MKLPSCPYGNSGLAIIDSERTTVGGEEQGVISRLFFTMPVQSSQSMYTGPTRSTNTKKDDNQLKRFLNL